MNRSEITAPFAPDEDFPYIFVSYAHVDRQRVFPIIKRIYEKGWRVWYDEGLELGGDYYQSLKKHIINCAVFLLFLSENSLKSDFITENEIPLAMEHQKKTVILGLDENLFEKCDIEGALKTDADNVESVLSQISFLEKTAPRKALGHTISENVLSHNRDSVYECEKCGGGVRLLSYSGNTSELILPESYPYLSDLKVVEVSKSMFWHHSELVSVRLPGTLKKIDLFCFSNNHALKRLYIPSSVTPVNTLNADLSKLGFTVYSAEDSPAHRFAVKNGISFVADDTLVSQNQETDSSYAYASFAYGEGTESFDALMILKECNCNYVMGRMGSPSEKKNKEMIKNCACFIAFINKAYVDGPYLDDLRLALSYSKPVAIWQLEECSLPENLEHLQNIHQLRYNTGTAREREIKLINWLTKNNCRDPYEIYGYEYRCSDTGIEITKYTGRSVCVDPPAYHCGIPVVSITGAHRLDHVCSVILPKTLKTVGYRAFSECNKLQDVILPDGIREIKAHAFSNCAMLKSLNLPDSIAHIGSGAFEGCKSLKNLTLPPHISVAGGAYSGWPYIKSVRVSLSETKIENYAFENCGLLAEVDMHDGITEIGERAFLGCKSLRNIYLPEGLKKIGASAFENCSKLESITLPSTLERTGINPFKGCDSLKEIRIMGMNTLLFVFRGELMSRTVYCVEGSVMQKKFEKAGIPYKLIK